MKRRYSFLLSPTWLGWLALCAVFALTCVFLSQWQIDRRELAQDEINRVVQNYDEEPVEYQQARGIFASPDDSQEWTVVNLTGEYLGEDAMLVRTRSHSGGVGFEQVVPFREASTQDVLVISRGWLPTANEHSGEPEFNPAPPSGEVNITVRVKPGEPEINRDAPEGQLASLDLEEFDSQVNYSVVQGAYGLMASEDPAPEEAPAQFARPTLDEGPHLSYSMQWIAFGLMAFVGWGYAARIHARNQALRAEETEDDGLHRAQGPSYQQRLKDVRRAERLRTGKLSDEDLEDAWVDQHQR